MVDRLVVESLALRQELRGDAQVLLRHVQGELLNRLVEPSVYLARDDLGAANREFEAFAAERLHEDCQRQLASALHGPRARPVQGQDANRDVAYLLRSQPVPQKPRRQQRAFAPGERRGVDAYRDRQARLVDADDRQRPGIVRGRPRLAGGDVGEARYGNELARGGFLPLLPPPR